MAAKMAHISDERHGPGTAGVWIAFTRLLTLAVFAQTIFAGLLLSGEVWGRAAHRATALGLVAAALLGGIVALATLRHVAGGRRLAVALLGLALVLAMQMTVGLLAAGGERLLWLHVPLGVALVGFTLETAGVARQLSPGGAVSRPSTTD